MSSQPPCPQCGAALPGDFGLVECESCHAMVFINMDGAANIQGENSSSAEEKNEDIENIQDAEFFESNWSPPEEPSQESLLPSNNPEDLSTNQESGESVEPNWESSPPEISNIDISEFANKEQSRAGTGQFVYDVEIYNIDSPEVRQALETALDDSRFSWQAEEVLAKIKDGRLRLEKLSAIKASVLLSKIKTLSVGLSWYQFDATEI